MTRDLDLTSVQLEWFKTSLKIFKVYLKHTLTSLEALHAWTGEDSRLSLNLETDVSFCRLGAEVVV